MSPTASPAQNLTVVGMAAAAGALFLAAAIIWRFGSGRNATACTLLAAAVAGLFVLRLLSA